MDLFALSGFWYIIHMWEEISGVTMVTSPVYHEFSGGERFCRMLLSASLLEHRSSFVHKPIMNCFTKFVFLCARVCVLVCVCLCLVGGVNMPKKAWNDGSVHFWSRSFSFPDFKTVDDRSSSCICSSLLYDFKQFWCGIWAHFWFWIEKSRPPL